MSKIKFFVQIDNAARIAERDLGVQILKSELNESNIIEGIQEVIKNSWQVPDYCLTTYILQ